MNITTIKKSGITTLTVKKLAQVIPLSYNNLWLVSQPKSDYNQSPYFYSNYPPTSDPSKLIPVGTSLQILAVHPGETNGTCHPHLEVLSSTGHHFYIYSKDIGRFCQ
jgi:hypothetical protein